MNVTSALIVAFRYNEAKELAKNLEKQANKVQAEAEDAGDKAVKIFANLTSIPPLDTKALEVTSQSEYVSIKVLLFFIMYIFTSWITDQSLCF